MERAPARSTSHAAPEAGSPAARPPAPPVDASALTAKTLRTRSVALAALEDHRAAMGRSAALLRAARALCRGGAAEAARPAARSTAPSAVPAASAPGSPSCARVGCHAPALFRPRFVVEAGGKRLRVDSIPLAICAHHRDVLLSEFRTPRVRDAFRRKLQERRGVEAVDVHVWFQTIQ